MGLIDGTYDTLIVEADDPDSIHASVRAKIGELRRLHSGAKFVVDYTGGTKSMTASLMLAALEHSDIELQLVVGQRQDLERVTDGTEVPMRANVDRIRFQSNWQVAMMPWRQFGYAQSVNSLEAMAHPTANDLRQVYLDSLTASRAFAAWDRFDHAEAARLLKSQSSRFAGYLQTVAALASDDCGRTEAARLLDMKLNMLRRAENGWYDDAVSRGYRLIEWTAQWLLRRDANIDASNVPSDSVPEDMRVFPDQSGVIKVGLRDAWQLLAVHGNERTKTFALEHIKRMLTIMNIRNDSILAHGFKPISDTEWQSLIDWCESGFFGLLESEAKASGVKKLPQQLPNEPAIFTQDLS